MIVILYISTRDYPGSHQFAHGPPSPTFAPPPQQIVIHKHGRHKSSHSHSHSQQVQHLKVYTIQPSTQLLQDPRARSPSRSPSPHRMPIPVAASHSAPPMRIPSPIHIIHSSHSPTYYGHGHSPSAMAVSHSAPPFPTHHAQISAYPPSTIPPLETHIQSLSISQGGRSQHKPTTPTSATRPLKSAMKPGREYNQYPERIILSHSSSSGNLKHPPSPSAHGRSPSHHQSGSHHNQSAVLTKPRPSHKHSNTTSSVPHMPGPMTAPLALQMENAPPITHIDERGRRRTTSFGMRPANAPGVSSTHATHGSNGTMHSSALQPQFQYSRCTGRRKALCVSDASLLNSFIIAQILSS